MSSLRLLRSVALALAVANATGANGALARETASAVPAASPEARATVPAPAPDSATSTAPAPIATPARTAAEAACPAATPAEDGRTWLPPGAIDPDLPWRVRDVDLSGVGFLRSWSLSSRLATVARPWWAVWRKARRFHPAYLAQDVETLVRAIEAEGYYEAKVTAEVAVVHAPDGGWSDSPLLPLPGWLFRRLPVPPGGERPPEESAGHSPGLVDVRIRIEQGEPTRVCWLGVGRDHVRDAAGEPVDEPMPAADAERLSRELPLAPGRIFSEDDYQRTAGMLGGWFADHGHPAPVVVPKAAVDVGTHCAWVDYSIAPGREAVFGETEIEGLGGLRPELASREIAWEPGERFDARLVRETERRLRGLRVFSLARVEPGAAVDGKVPMKLTLAPGNSQEVRLGVGYSSEEGARGLASWWNYNAFGHGEQLGFSARISQVNRIVSASWVEPHFPGVRNRTAVTFNLGVDDETTYKDNFGRLTPQIDWRLTRRLTGSLFVRGAYDSLSNVSDATKDALGVYQNVGFTFSAGGSARWVNVDDLLDPRVGVVLDLSTEVAGPVLGGDFDWVRPIATMRAYRPVWGDLMGALRITLGTIPPWNGTPQIPLWSRFYAGGIGIYGVRGYGRWRLGPITASNDPLGGRTLALGSLEARYPLWGPLKGVLFVDTGDLELSAWTIRPRNFQTGVGFGVRAATPIGPVQLDLGFGLDRPRGDSLVQVAFSIGPEF